MKKVSFKIDYNVDFECVGAPIPKIISMDVLVDLEEEEIEKIKELIKVSTFDQEAGIMPILRSDAPDIYYRLDREFQEFIKVEMLQRDKEIVNIFAGDEPDDFEFQYDEEELESYDDVSYICHIPTELDAKKHTSEISPEEQYNNSITVEDITKDSAIDSSEQKVLTYSHPHDTCDGIEIHLGNQAMGYPFTCLGHNWKAIEYLYLCGEWSWEGEDAKAIQEDVLTARSGYAAAAYKRTKYRKRRRADYETFRDQWMLWCVWQKCLGNEDYRKHLLSMPDDRVIIEAIKRDKVWAAWPDDNGIYHGANGMGKIITICRRCLKEGASPAIDTALLNSKDIYILGEKVQF